MKFSLCFLLVSFIGSAQVVTFGAKGGGILTDPAEHYDESRRYVVGPYIEVHLPLHFAIEGGALYSRFGSSIPSSSTTAGTLRTRADLWQFPVLGKYYITKTHEGGAHPFASAGVAFRKLWLDNSQSAPSQVTAGNFRNLLFRGESDVSTGASFGGGIDFKIRRFGVAPEFRYIRWEGQRFPVTNHNEAQILLGIHF